MKYVKEIIEGMGNGCTIPLSCLLNNDEVAIVKTFNNIQGNLTLVNEFVSYKIADCLGMTIPECGICVIDDNTIDKNKLVEEINFGIGFYSKRIDSVTILNNHQILSLIQNRADIAKCILFDHLIYNKDRNQGNLIISMKESLMYIIDHTHVFNKECLWDQWQLKQCIEGNDYKDRDILTGNEYLYKLFIQNKKITPSELEKNCNEFKEKLNKEKIENIVKSIPKEWKLSEEDSNALIDYLIYRLNNLEAICSIIVEEHKLVEEE